MEPLEITNRMKFPPNGEIFPANIFKGHGRTHCVYLFIKWGKKADSDLSTDDLEEKASAETIDKAKKFIQFLLGEGLTSHDDQKKDISLFKNSVNNEERPVHQSFVKCFFLSKEGYINLGIKKDHIPKDLVNERDLFDRMQSLPMRSLFHDYSNIRYPDVIEENYLKRYDAMLLIAHEDKTAIIKELERIKQTRAFTELNPLSFEEWGEQFYEDKDKQLGPLGFRDNISNEDEPEEIWKKVMFEEPYPKNPGKVSHGSFFIFRKLEVKHDVFEYMIKSTALKLSKQVFPNLADRLKLAEGILMGRFKDGTPAIKYKEPQGKDIPENNFYHMDDEKGYKCPFSAHIRATNPRLLSPGESSNIIRRGITYYGSENKFDRPSGLLFMSYQKSINEIIKIFERMEEEKDFLVYRTKKKTEESDFFSVYGKDREKEQLQIGGRDLTEFKGGEIFFAPSLLFLREISKPTEA